MKKSLILVWGLLLISCDNQLDTSTAGNLVPKTVDQDSSLPSILINGTQLHSETYGNPENSMVVFLHGGPGADYRNALQVSSLADDGYYVVFYDQRGSGLSKRHSKNSYTIDIMFEDLEEVINYYKTSEDQKVYLFGHSWGAILATGYINKYPSRIDGMILAEAGGLTSDDLEEYGALSRKLELFEETTNDVFYLDQFLSGNEDDHEILDYKLAVNTAYSYADGNTEGIEGPSPFWRFGVATLTGLADIADEDGYDFTTNLNQYQTNVLLLYSELNTSYGLSFAEKEAAYFINTTIKQINNTGHELIYFRWESVYSEVLNYLNSLN